MDKQKRMGASKGKLMEDRKENGIIRGYLRSRNVKGTKSSYMNC